MRIEGVLTLAFLFAFAGELLSRSLDSPFVAVVAATNSCALTGISPRRYEVNLCTSYSLTEGCCLAGVDATVRSSLVGITNNGVAECQMASNHIMALMSDIRAWMCMPCSRNEPRYRFLLKDGDIHIGGLAPPNPAADPEAYGWRVCKSFLYGSNRLQGVWGGDGSKYDNCGLNLPSCNQVSMVAYDSSTSSWTTEAAGSCSDSGYVIPSVAFGGSETPAEQILLRIPSAISDFTFFVVDETDPLYDSNTAPCLASVNGALGTSISFVVVGLMVFAATTLASM